MKTQGFNYRILVVDDEPAVLEIAALVLQERGYEVRKAKDGFQALVELRRSVPDLIISDLRMPNMSAGMGHCGEGAGLNQFEMVAALDSWRQQGDAPKSITAVRVDEHAHIDMSRPLCPYPQIAAYNGSGDIDDAQNYVCKASGN